MAQSLYEVHTLKGGQWEIDSTYPDRESSIEVAKQLHGEKRFDAIKVIKDTFDPQSGKGKEIVVYDTSRTPRDKKAPQTAAAKAAEAAAAKAGSDTSRPSHDSRSKPANKDLSVALKAVLWLALILVGGLGLLFLVTKAGDMMGKGF